MLGVVLLTVGLVLAFPFRNYLAAQADLVQQQATEAALRAELAQVQAQKQALLDPNYVRVQARSRLEYVMPGDTVYVVHAPTPAAPKVTTAPAAPPDSPWYSRLWDTLGDPAAAHR